MLPMATELMRRPIGSLAFQSAWHEVCQPQPSSDDELLLPMHEVLLTLSQVAGAGRQEAGLMKHNCICSAAASQGYRQATPCCTSLDACNSWHKQDASMTLNRNSW